MDKRFKRAYNPPPEKEGRSQKPTPPPPEVKDDLLKLAHKAGLYAPNPMKDAIFRERIKEALPEIILDLIKTNHGGFGTAINQALTEIRYNHKG